MCVGSGVLPIFLAIFERRRQLDDDDNERRTTTTTTKRRRRRTTPMTTPHDERGRTTGRTTNDYDKRTTTNERRRHRHLLIICIRRMSVSFKKEHAPLRTATGWVLTSPALREKRWARGWTGQQPEGGRPRIDEYSASEDGGRNRNAEFLPP